MKNTLSRNAYPSDLTQAQWDEIDLLLPRESEQGRAREHSLREVVNAMNYRWTTGCSWRMLPHDFPVWQTVYSYFRTWQSLGLLGEIRRILLSRKLRNRSSKRAPEMPETTSPERPLSTSESPRPLPEATSPRLTSSHWPTESV
ncbi:MAG: transposase [Planctomycetaceae bacterium]|nr:transposase [Planctomycetaceae bacterium]